MHKMKRETLATYVKEHALHEYGCIFQLAGCIFGFN